MAAVAAASPTPLSNGNGVHSPAPVRRGSVSYVFHKIRTASKDRERGGSISYIKPSSSSPDLTTRSYRAKAEQEESRWNGITSPCSSPMSKSKSRKSIWSRKQHREAPPVPDLPHSLELDLLPFEREPASTSATPAPDDSVAPQRESGAATEAAGIAQQVTQQYAEKERKLKDSGITRAQVLSEARLTPSQVAEVVKLAGAEIKQRGLANVGIFRPFRVGASPEAVDRMAELYLLSVDAERYEGTLSVVDAKGSDLAVATFGKPSATRELAKQLAYAKVCDVADFLKWSFRRLKVSRLDFSSTNHLTWYNTFVKAEKDQGYPRNAYSALLLPHLPTDTQRLLNDTLDLLTSVSAHYVANAMPAWRICKTFGFWLFGRIESDKVATDLSAFLDEWARSSSIMEHLYLAYLRDQSTKVHYMPTRLTQLIDDYPRVSAQSEVGAPGLHVKRGAEVVAKALKVTLSSENVQARSLRNPRGPSDTLASALTAKLYNGESSAEADDWAALVGLAQKATREVHASPDAAAQETEDSATGETPATAAPAAASEEELELARELALLRDEDSRIFAILAAEIAQRKTMMGNGSTARDSESKTQVAMPSYGSIASLYSSSARQGDAAASLPRIGSYANTSRYKLNGSTTLDPLPETSAPNTPTRAEAASTPPKVDWDVFRDGGFATSSNEKASGVDLSLDEVSAKPRPSESFSIASGSSRPAAMQNGSSSSAGLLRRATSFGTLRRKGGRDSSVNGSGDSLLGHAKQQRPRTAKPRHSITAVTTMDLDEVLVSVWQDALLDFCPAAMLPGFVAAQLNRNAAANLMSGGATSSPSSTAAAPAAPTAGMNWLVVEEKIVPRPTAVTRGNGTLPTKGSRSAIRRAQSSGRGVPRINAGVHLDDVEDFDEEDEENTLRYDNDGASSTDGRRSLFAPSFKSLKAMSLNLRKRASVRKMSSIAGGLRKRANADAQSPPATADGTARETMAEGTGSPSTDAVPPLPSTSATPTKKAKKRPLVSLSIGKNTTNTTNAPPVAAGGSSWDRTSIISSPASSTPAVDASVLHAVSPAAFAASGAVAATPKASALRHSSSGSRSGEGDGQQMGSSALLGTNGATTTARSSMQTGRSKYEDAAAGDDE
ncbi:hypothetical protein BDZ90DRAFT_233660 [Jaminaea rosea]|uniref:Meiotically up-regulated protein Msb1/Mug8 domain-containing protein n=1 Tax=Jaminaea rosea TaxID=1569628 RepID=A0A316ULB5_9BASI|nr:hypothetical protein BDZ90DRAFT_233660 [Jaminaea rosea]PWN26076.1 hypothetical protein BDZ90DRAFT_233660 [Jaminaea rosea]